MAAYQCLNCLQIESLEKDCCTQPDLYCVNDMPFGVKRMRDLLLKLEDAVEALDGTSAKNEKIVDDYRNWKQTL